MLWCKIIIEIDKELNFSQVHFDDVSLYGTPKEEPLPSMPSSMEKPSSNFLKNQLQAWFQPTDNRLAMKLFGSKKALVKERIRQKTAGHWVIHPCSSFRWVSLWCKMCVSIWRNKHLHELDSNKTNNNRKSLGKNNETLCTKTITHYIVEEKAKGEKIDFEFVFSW